MIDYFNQNQGFAMVLLTAVYVVATIILVVVSQIQANLAKKSLDFASKAEKSKHRPYVIFDVVYERIVAYAKVRNVGATPAVDIKIAVTPKLKWKDKDEGVGFIEDGIAYLAPDRELSQPFGWMKEFKDQYPDLVFSGSVSYKDRDGIEYEEPFYIDISYIRKETYIGDVDLPKEVEKIRKALEGFQRSKYNPLVRVIDEDEFQKREKERRENAPKLEDLIEEK